MVRIFKSKGIRFVLLSGPDLKVLELDDSVPSIGHLDDAIGKLK